jgi:hypothetical protein
LELDCEHVLVGRDDPEPPEPVVVMAGALNPVAVTSDGFRVELISVLSHSIQIDFSDNRLLRVSIPAGDQFESSGVNRANVG